MIPQRVGKSFVLSDEAEEKTRLHSTSIIWLLPIMTSVFMLSFLPFGIYSDHWLPLFITLIISLTIASAIHLTWRKGHSFGSALIALLLPLYLIGNFFQFLSFLIPAAALLIILFTLKNLFRIDLKKYFLSVCALFASGLFLDFILVQRKEISSIDTFLRFGFGKDFIFHSAVASMIKNYGISTIGLDGLHPMRYHTASHAIFAALSLASKMSVMDIYTYIFPLVVLPLFFTSILCLIEEMAPSKLKSVWVVFGRSALLGILFVGIEGKIFQDAAFWVSFYDSESYALSLVVLMGLLSALFKREKLSDLESLVPNTISILSLFIFSCLSKISVGCVFLVFLGSWALFGKSNFFWHRFALLFSCFGLLILGMRMTAGSPVEFLLFHFLNNYVVSDLLIPIFLNVNIFQKLGFFLIFHLAFSNIAILIYFFGIKRKSFDLVLNWQIFGIGLSTVIGILPGVILNIPGGGSAYYFSNVSQMIALPFLLLMILFLFEKVRIFAQKRVSDQIKGIKISIIVISFLLFADLYFVFIPSVFHRIAVFRASIKTLQLDVAFPYGLNIITELRKVRDDPQTKDMMVYIPRSLKTFWDLDHCGKIGFLLPAVSERPAIRGLPTPDCNVEDFGYRDYNMDSRNRALLQDSDETLLKEAKAFGFNGVVVVTEKSHRFIR